MGKIRFFSSIYLIFAGLFFFSSCNKALHNIGRTALLDQRFEIRDTSPDLKLWQTEDLAINYQLEDNDTTITISGTVAISGRITVVYPVFDFLNIYVNFLDQNGVATSKYDICPIISRYNTAPGQVAFSKTLQKDENSASIAFSYWGNFRDRGMSSRGDVIEWEIFYNPFE